MTEQDRNRQDQGHVPDDESEERLPMMQRMLDNPFLLLFLGVTVPSVSYIIWGVMEIVTIPIGR